MRSVLSLFLLAILHLLSLKIGIEWQRWTSLEHPTAVLLPLPLLISVLGCMVLDRLSGTPFRLPRLGESGISVARTAFITALLALGLYIAYSCLSDARASIGRLVLVLGWVYVGGLLALQVTLSLKTLKLVSFLRQKWTKRALAALLGLIISVGCIAALEFACGVLLSRQQPGPQKTYEGNYLDSGAFFRTDDNLGIALEPNREVRCNLKVNGKETWNTRYSTDQYGRRSTIPSQHKKATNLAVFFGCSFVFGEGANDDETIPSQFARIMPDYQAVNYGVPGWGPQHMLALLESGEVPKQNPTDGKVIGIYVYLQEVHEARVVGEMDIVNSFGKNFPFYELSSSKSVERHGAFSTHRRSINLLYRLLGRSNIRAIAGLNFPRRIQSHYQLTAAIAARSRQLFLQQFPGSQFLVVPYPAHGEESPFLSLSRESGLTVLPTRHIFNPSETTWHYVGDGHPTPAANMKLSMEIADWITENGDAK